MQRVRATFISPKEHWSNLTLVLGLVCVGSKARLFVSAACQGQGHVKTVVVKSAVYCALSAIKHTSQMSMCQGS